MRVQLNRGVRRALIGVILGVVAVGGPAIVAGKHLLAVRGLWISTGGGVTLRLTLVDNHGRIAGLGVASSPSSDRAWALKVTGLRAGRVVALRLEDETGGVITLDGYRIGVHEMNLRWGNGNEIRLQRRRRPREASLEERTARYRARRALDSARAVAGPPPPPMPMDSAFP